MTTRASLALAPVLALALGGCSPLVGGTIDESRICLAMQSQTIPGAVLPGGLPAQTVSYDGSLDVGSKIPGLDKPGAVTGSIHALSLTTTANPSTTNLAVIDSAEVDVLDASGNATKIMHYTRPAGVTTATELDMVLDQDLDLLPEMQAGALRYRITFTGHPPSNSWTADIETCLSAHLTVDALKL